MASNVAALAALLSVVSLSQAQQAPTPDNHPSLPTWKCTTAGGCVQQQTSLVVDWVYHWIHQINGSTSCSLTSGCTDAATCYQDCEISPATYSDLGINTSGSAVTLNQYVNGTSASPRVYLLDPSGQDYEMLQLTGQEISFDVDVSNLPCGENGALYLSEMSATGGRSATNPAGASYGSGYCDAQCGSSSWFNGAPNPSGLGSCCNEMDLWEANSEATALTPHSCTVEGPYGCTGTACGSSGVCDKDGCGFNPYAMGNHSFYGPGAGSVIDTSKPFTVTTQFLTTDGTKTGSLSEIRRYYTQNGQVIANSVSTASGVAGDNSLTPAFCQIEDSAMASQFGGFNAIGGALSRGMVLIFSIWNDNSQNMNWLDSGNSGPCSSTAGSPATILANDPGTSVTFSNIKWGDLGSTFGGPGTGPSSSTTTTTTTTSASTTTSTTTTTTSPAGPAQTHWGQCGGQGWTGPTTCQSPYTCQVSNPWYSQCL